MPTQSSSPKTTRPPATARRSKKTASAKSNIKKYDAFPDKIDVRDWIYQPSLSPLPDQLINCSYVPTILNQGTEGACTGFALAAVINYQLATNKNLARERINTRGASPRMLYEMARRYDEWPGENYDGSSARGTIKGWVAHGVASRKTWADDVHGPHNLDEAKAKEALNIPAGAYYRVLHRQVRDMHAALNETGALFATMMVHRGWDADMLKKSPKVTYAIDGNDSIKLPIIERNGRAAWGHAIAIVGYTKDGFIIQNSWGNNWGIKGFALLPYEDWMLHASDCWVVQLGVPIKTDLWRVGRADTSAGKQRASNVIPLEEIRPYTINIGNNGNLSDSGMYWTTQEDVRRMFENINTTTANWKKKRIMLYLHGGLNSEKEVARRVISYKDVCLENEIYPIHIMWETDFWSSLKNDLFDLFTDEDKASASWLSKLRDATLEIKDRTFELTSARLGTMLWNEMKENARLASERKGAAMDIISTAALQAFQKLAAKEQKDWELHIVAHSAGSIFTAYAIDKLLTTGLTLKSVQFMAPAITIDLFKEKMLSHILREICPVPTLYVLSDEGERDDNVSIYGKSLLYLVSNAFEPSRETALLGMEKFVRKIPNDDSSNPDAQVAKLFKQKVNNWDSLIIAGTVPPPKDKEGERPRPDNSRSDTHGGFDNDPCTLNSVLFRILNGKPKRAFVLRDLQF